MSIRNKAIALAGATLIAGLSHFEGRRLVDYMDRIPVKPTPTACYGHTATAKVGKVRTIAECDAQLRSDLTQVYGPAVLSAIKVEVTQGQFDAMTDFAYNLGIGNFQRSTLLRKVNSSDFTGAALEFEKWHMAGGKDCRIRANGCYGIVDRRLWERHTFESKD